MTGNLHFGGAHGRSQVKTVAKAKASPKEKKEKK
ncbi:MAG: hypothetical protein UW82_C0009G0007 [candidate division WWE3 bacterium GW2011_GWC2_44_9]|uniref:Uncharacterized protein n=1 Tax=candidate division WWE3 bacterium GW2011_GWC2_44_9 TaxID=1619125 RepID=A0A0G1NKU4_UNCKA|nr:MAG: hypothetical protein UW82_C0009G0007 [candidate division WWE3 bacterium GW2011_GWC2_44_9]